MQTSPELNSSDLLPPFKGAMAGRLCSLAEKELSQCHSLTRQSYSTRRFISSAPSKPDTLLGAIALKEGRLLYCEASSPELVRYCAQHGLTLASDADALTAYPSIAASIAEVIKPYPFLWDSLSQLTWRCHVVLAQDDDYDVSFSDPVIPFSIFISAPMRRDRRSLLRVAESLVHETMHLQLTLFEAACPLIRRDASWSMYSPWKQERRPAQGILHGLYVFSVLRWMWQQVSRKEDCSEDQTFALRRINEIDEEIEAVRALEDSPALTGAGHSFIQRLLAVEPTNNDSE